MPYKTDILIKHSVVCKNRRVYLFFKDVIKLPCSRGDSGALYLQSARAGVMSLPRVMICKAALYKWR